MDDIVAEVRRIREEYAARFHYDLDAIHRDLLRYQEQLRAEGWRFVEPVRPPRIDHLPSAQGAGDEDLRMSTSPANERLNPHVPTGLVAKAQ